MVSTQGLVYARQVFYNELHSQPLLYVVHCQCYSPSFNTQTLKTFSFNCYSWACLLLDSFLLIPYFVYYFCELTLADHFKYFGFHPWPLTPWIWVLLCVFLLVVLIYQVCECLPFANFCIVYLLFSALLITCVFHSLSWILFHIELFLFLELPSLVLLLSYSLTNLGIPQPQSLGLYFLYRLKQ